MRCLPVSALLLALATSLLPTRSPAAAHSELAPRVHQLFNKHCTKCHGGVKRAGDVSFISRDLALRPAKSGAIPLQPGSLDGSELFRRVTTQDEDDRMPPIKEEPRLSDDEVALLREWIEQGAPWEAHWAYTPPTPHAPPAVSDEGWCRQPIDAFILARLDAAGLSPAPQAQRVQWLRRVSLDLTGLPPSPEQLRDFRNDRAPGAHARAVDALLDSPHFGERWASMWLDLARYADSQGYEKDGGRTAWPYRDWLIRAFNEDMPFDQFTLQQLAGDLLPEADLDAIVATAFHRNTPTNTEGGTDDEEFRLTAALDRVATTWKTWQALSFNCVQCHSHPYEPIDHDDFYRFLAFFNTSQDWDLTSDVPKLDVPLDIAEFPQARDLDRRLADLKSREHTHSQAIAADSAQWKPLKPTHAESTGQTQMKIREVEGGTAEVLTEGTVSHDSRFTIDLAVPDATPALTALRIDAFPLDAERAAFNPELGFILSEVRAQFLTGENQADRDLHAKALAEAREAEAKAKDDEKKPLKKEADELEATPPGNVELAFAFGDETDPFQDAQRTLHPDDQGWGALPRITGPRHLILVPRTPVPIPKGAVLRLVIRQEAAPNDMAPLVMNRSRYALTDRPAWTDWVSEEAFGKDREQMTALARERRGIKSAALPVMAEQQSNFQRGTAVFQRGNWLNKGRPVTAGVPSLFPQLNPETSADRLAMARWLVSLDNPLTARVAVNRFWEQIFGTGIVETVEDFGSTGQSPSHPLLLDDLAARFQTDMGWSVKTLLRELVLSSAYRQSHASRAQELEKDPDNRLLSRGPRNRLTAEMVRDNALAVSGLLSLDMYGPPVMPPQPDGIWRAARSSMKWEPSQGADAHRRALYTYWRRSSPYPSLLTFDAPNRLVCSARRIATSTPLQALVTLNDPVYMECAVALARRMQEEGGDRLRRQIVRGYRLATGRRPMAPDLADLMELHRTALDAYQADPKLAEPLGHDPNVAALALVANAILNLDVVLTK